MRLGAYELGARLGEGGAGVVFRAHGPAGEVAIKLLRRTTPDALARFEREARLQRQLGTKEGFVPLLEVGEWAEGPYLVMPLLRGGTLRAKLVRGPLSLDAVVALGVALGLALGRAHALGIVHRDVKPENVLFDEAGRPFLADLGLAKHFSALAPGASQSASVSVNGVLLGTAGYMAPEQAADSSGAGPAADVFSLGAVLYECVSGRPAFAGESIIEVLTKVEEGRVERLEGPPWLVSIVERALERDPRARFLDGAALARALGARSRGEVRASGRSRTVAIFAALSALALLGGGGALVALGPMATKSPARAVPRGRDAHATSAVVERPGSGPSAPFDPTDAVRQIRANAEAGETRAMYYLACILATGEGVPQDDVEAVRWFRMASSAGDPRAMAKLGVMLANGRGGARDEVEAVQCFRRAADSGVAEAMCGLGFMLERGQGVPKDEAEAAMWYRRSAEGGDAQGMRYLGNALVDGTGVDQDESEAALWYRKAAERGDVPSMCNLGAMLANGRGVAADSLEASTWIRKAAEAGDPHGMCYLGNMLMTGVGLPKDPAEASRWFRKGAEAGESLAMANLGVALMHGLGVAPDEVEAVGWLRKAALAGNSTGMHALAVALENGRGVSRDQAQALLWFRAAAALGDESSRDALKRLGE